MPELAEVEFYRRRWSIGIGDRVERVSLHPSARVFRNAKPARIRRELPGSTFKGAEARGKQLLFTFRPNLWLGGHLGMTGKLLVTGARYKPEKHDHLVIHLPNHSLVFQDSRMFGQIRFERALSAPDWWAGLPPEILSETFTKDLVRGFLERHPKTLIKPLLLDQSAFPGIGNWMADEVLWRCRLSPESRTGSLDREAADALWKQLRAVSRDAMKVIAPDWGTPPDSWLFNHRWKDGGICPRPQCRRPLTRKDVRGRTTCWCPACQPA